MAGDGRKLRIVSMVPVERIEEFVDGPVYGVWRSRRSRGLRRVSGAIAMAVVVRSLAEGDQGCMRARSVQPV